jgi:predicted TIM-barrel fold metal-dependent hydrolase
MQDGEARRGQDGPGAEARLSPRSTVLSPPRVVDVDLHHQIPDWKAVAPYAPAGLRHRVARPGGPPLARHGFQMVGAPFGTAPLPAGAGTPPHPATDPAWVAEHYLKARGVDLAILTGSQFSLSAQPNPDMAATFATGLNDWTLATWVRPFDCFKGSILVAPQDAELAVAEIDRLGDDPGMVQVLIGSGAESPLGRRQYHPIYAACVRHNLPLALHCGGEGAGSTPPATAVGHPSTYFEWYGSLPQSYMAHITSMITEGVFERFPTLKVILYESGLFWFPHLMWRFDKNWKAQRGETPWVKEPPSQYMLRHFYLSLYPLEAAPGPAELEQTLAMIEGERRLLFGSSYPEWRYGDPFDQVAELPAPLRPAVLAGNALAIYGERLLASHR